MKLTQAEVIVLKNRPMSREERETKESKLRGKAEEHSIFVRLTAEQDGKPLVGLGEARPSRASEESLASAARYARRLSRGLVGQTLETSDGSPVECASGLVQQVVSELFGLGSLSIAQQRPSPSVCFAMECALLDLQAKQQGVSIGELCGVEQQGVQRNVFNEPLKNTDKLLKGIGQGDTVHGWLRRGKRIGAKQAATLVNSLLFALGGKAPNLQGIMLNAGQRWTPEDWANFCDEVTLTGLAAKQGVTILVEDPFREEADAFYQQAFAKAEGTPVRIMLGKPVWGVESIKTLAPYMPHVDLKITPQKAGGFHEVLAAEREAEAQGFEGGIYLAGVNGTTNLNTLAMASLAGSMRHCRYFSTSFKQESKTRLVHPRATLENDTLLAPEGPGFAVNLCRSGLRRRLVALNAYGLEGSVNRREARLELLESTYDDRFLQREENEQRRFKVSDSELSNTLNPANS